VSAGASRIHGVPVELLSAAAGDLLSAAEPASTRRQAAIDAFESIVVGSYPYRGILEGAGCTVMTAKDTGRFAPYVDLYLEMVDKQLTYDALRILDFNTDALGAIGAEMQFLRELAHAGKIAQGRFIAQKR
jgi:hypothetical protein